MENKLSNLTLEQKITLLTGKDAWNIHDIPCLDKFNMADGPCGLRKVSWWADGSELHHRSVAYATCSVLANSWDKELVKTAASCMADDCIDNAVDMLLAPGINIKRDPRCGRNFEYLSEDPLLAGTLAKEYIDGLQEKGVGTSLKHFFANNSETARKIISANISKRAIMEIYTRNFYYAIKANPTTIMTAYNRVNGLWCAESKPNLDLLYNKLGFKGACVSDWVSIHDKIKSVKAGLALQMPYEDFCYPAVKKALDDGELVEADIDKCCQRTIDLINRIQEMKPLRIPTTHTQDRLAVAEKGALEGAVLLKNNGVLPLQKGKKLGITGTFLMSSYCGGGSAHVWSFNPNDDLETAIKYYQPSANIVNVKNIISNSNNSGYVIHNHPDEIAQKFDNPDYCIITAGTDRRTESEGGDRIHIKLTNAEESFIRYFGDKYKGKTVVVLTSGSAIDCSGWIDRVDAVIYSGYGGERMNYAMARLLFGDANPCGKLAETFPKKLEDISCLNTVNDYLTEDNYVDDIYVGYRHYDKNNIEPRFEFGYGLSYSTFEYSDLAVKDCGDGVEVSYKIKNVSDVDGKEISQIYYSAPCKAIDRPVKELCEYSKDLIKAGEEKVITLKIDKERLTYFDVEKDDFVMEKGEHTIMVGASSRNIKLTAKINL